MRVVGLWERWQTLDWRTRGFFVSLAMLCAVLAFGGVVGAVQQYRFNELPAEEQERIRAENKRREEQSSRQLREDIRREVARRAEQIEMEKVQEQERATRQAELEMHKANVEACVEAAEKYLPGIWPSAEAKARIEADCAMREARSERPGRAPGSN